MITVLAFRQADKNITRHDVIILIAALSAVPLWIMTSNPFVAIVIVTIIDLLGYLPTLRKVWVKPGEEMAMSYIITNFKHFAGFFAMNVYSWTTLLYPTALVIANTVLVVIIYVRRFKCQAN